MTHDTLSLSGGGGSGSSSGEGVSGHSPSPGGGVSEEEFVRRFTAEMLRLVGPTYFEEDDPEPMSTADYGAEVGPSYYAEPSQREEGPEECARADYSYWGD